MNTRSLLWLGLATAASITTATAEPSAAPQAKAEVSIPFANHGGIRSWKADRDEGLWIQDAHGDWYYASFFGPCDGLDFAVGLGFDTHPTQSFDQFSSVIVPHAGECKVRSVVQSAGPPVRKAGSAASPAAVTTDQQGDVPSGTTREAH